jgi:hypothetical protein
MVRRLFLASSAAAALVLALPSPAFAGGSAWGEISFQVTSGTAIARLVGRRDATSPMNAFRYQVKEGDTPWTSSHAEGSGVVVATFQALRADASTAQPEFDGEAASALGTWYLAQSPAVQGLLRDVTRRTTSVGFSVRLQSAGHSGPATLGDLQAMQDAVLIGDRAAFDDAATIAWGSWYTGLDPLDADIVHGVIIDLTGAG